MTYDKRDEVLVKLGFRNYRSYLESDLWQSIRVRVFAKGRRCWICRRRRKATQVHHEYYTTSNLKGETLSGLRPVCRACHYLIEFTDGDKLSNRASRRKSSALRNSSTKFKQKRASRIDQAMRRAEQMGLDAEFRRLIERDD